MWAGTAINDTSSVVAASYSFSHEAGNFATIVKLTRTLMIVPIAVHDRRRHTGSFYSVNFSFLAVQMDGTVIPAYDPSAIDYTYPQAVMQQPPPPLPHQQQMVATAQPPPSTVPVMSTAAPVAATTTASTTAATK